MIERQIDISTQDGAAPEQGMGVFIARPDRGGPFPVVILYMDAPGIREELRDMARRMAAVAIT